MTQLELIKKQIKKCLNCRIGVRIIADYRNMIAITNLNDESNKEVIEDMSEDLQIKGNIKEKYEILKRLYSRNFFDETETNICLINLQRIIFAIRDLYRDNNDDDIIFTQNYFSYILSVMDESNKTKLKNYDDGKSGEALKLLSQSKSCGGLKSEVASGIRYIFNRFCYPKSSESYAINVKDECIRKIFFEYADALPDSSIGNNKKEFFQRAKKLSTDLRDILFDYLCYAPKKFGYNLQFIMNKHNMTEQDVATLIGVTASSIQTLKTCNTPKRDKNTIELLCRVLGVSKDVLYKGIGTTYGSWKELFTDENLKEIREKEKLKNKTEAISFVRKQIHRLSTLDETSFKEMLSEYPEFFAEEEICTCCELEECFDILLHKEDAYALLEILEKRNNI